jgi:hypothetical protein
VLAFVGSLWPVHLIAADVKDGSLDFESSQQWPETGIALHTFIATYVG